MTTNDLSSAFERKQHSMSDRESSFSPLEISILFFSFQLTCRRTKQDVVRRIELFYIDTVRVLHALFEF